MNTKQLDKLISVPTGNDVDSIRARIRHLHESINADKTALGHMVAASMSKNKKYKSLKASIEANGKELGALNERLRSLEGDEIPAGQGPAILPSERILTEHFALRFLTRILGEQTDSILPPALLSLASKTDKDRTSFYLVRSRVFGNITVYASGGKVRTCYHTSSDRELRYAAEFDLEEGLNWFQILRLKALWAIEKTVRRWRHGILK